ncbi:guanine nucleotide binding protein, alpha subunit [Crassisporium funariophilum]|nr:guanine nucleotide binding protein, alpha subunit [Crassisporium funariophilum]
MILTYDSVDPLSMAMAPPPNETAIERMARERLELEAVQRSRRIDAELKAAKAAMKKHKKAIKVLVLGQSLSGKSTTIKNFQMTYAARSWSDERASWKAVVLLNLVRSVNAIVDVISHEQGFNNEDTLDTSLRDLSRAPRRTASEVTIPTEQHRSVVLRLAPLRQIEKDLKIFLGAGASEIEVSQRFITDDLQANVHLEFNKPVFQEFCVRSTSGWKGILDQVRVAQSGKDAQLHRVACHVVASCREDIRWLWNDPVTQKMLRDRQLRLEDAPGFFLDDIDRITAREYQPSDQDIVRARLRTTGVQEYHFTLDRANATDLDWIMYDVAGIRTSRAAWIPYFREITALIFLAPLSAFNERLAEDNRVNRLEDTFVLWKTICSSRLLEDVQIILFMNKTDLLRKKLEQGIRVKKYIPEFDKSNDYETVSTWLRRVFKRIYLDHNVGKTFISHFTSVIDTKATAHTLEAVQATILRNDITDAGLM